MALTEKEIGIFNALIDIANDKIADMELALFELKSDNKRIVVIGIIKEEGEESLIYPIAKLLEDQETFRLDFKDIIELN